MKFAEQIERLQYLDKLIRKQKTGSPAELAGRLDISRSQLYNLIGYLNDIGMEVNYSRVRKCFYYKNQNKNIDINFSIKIISNKDVQTIFGGSAGVLEHQYIKHFI